MPLNISSDIDETHTKTEALREESDSTPKRRGFPAPFNSPPFPNGEWPIGGTSVIGAPDTSGAYPLMKALQGTTLGNFLEDNRIHVYGWASTGANLSSSSHYNYPTSYNVFPNRVDLDQLAITLERIPDTIQREYADWGFRITGFYGIDYRFTTAKGLFSNQLLEKNRQYGFDPVLAYYDLYIPKVAQGMNIRIGRFLSIPAIEAQLAPDNYMYTHSLLYTVDAYTQTGVIASTKLNNQWTIQTGLTVGNDIMPWEVGAKPTGLLPYSGSPNRTKTPSTW